MTKPKRSSGAWLRSPLASAYLQSLRRELATWCRDPDEIEVIVQEIESHLAEARHSGESVASAIRLLGPPRELAESYAVVSFESRRSRSSQLAAAWASASRVAQTAAAGIMIALAAGTSVLSFVLGLGAILGAVVLPFVPARLLEPTLRLGLPQLVVLLAGALLLTLAFALGRWLVHHLRLLRRGRATQTRADAARDRHPAAGLIPFPKPTVDPEEELRS